ncbi:MAG: hypothetical protein RBU30_00480 [Polyangia bacterium]|jgi:hypothetical protein|nr:hypothetical protein [Polyangia bacterium]
MKNEPRTTEDMSEITPGSGSIADGSNFLADLEGFTLGFKSLGDLLGFREDQLDCLIVLGDRLLAGGRITEAITIFEGALALDPGRLGLYCRLATCHLADGSPLLASDYLSAARAHLGECDLLDGFEDAIMAKIAHTQHDQV